MSTPSDALDVEAIARELMEARVQSVRELADAGAAWAAAEQASADAAATYARLHAAALKNGWTEGELSRMRLAKPGTRVRKRSTSRASASPGTSSAADEVQGGAQNGGPGDDGSGTYS